MSYRILTQATVKDDGFAIDFESGSDAQKHMSAYIDRHRGMLDYALGVSSLTVTCGDGATITALK